MVKDRDTISGTPHVALETGGAHLECDLERLERVVGRRHTTISLSEEDRVVGTLVGNRHPPSLPVLRAVERGDRPRLGIVDGAWLLVAFGLVAAVAVVTRISLLLTRELVLAAESFSRLGRLSVSVGDLVRSARRLGVDPAGQR